MELYVLAFSGLKSILLCEWRFWIKESYVFEMQSTLLACLSVLLRGMTGLVARRIAVIMEEARLRGLWIQSPAVGPKPGVKLSPTPLVTVLKKGEKVGMDPPSEAWEMFEPHKCCKANFSGISLSSLLFPSEFSFFLLFFFPPCSLLSLALLPLPPPVPSQQCSILHILAVSFFLDF